MKIVHIVTVSESLTFLSGLPKYLQGENHEVIVICRPDSGMEAFGESEGIRTRGVSMQRKISPVADLVSIMRIVRILKNEKPDIVHAHTPKGGLLGTIASRIAGVPITIYHIRGLPYMGMQGLSRWLMKTTERISCRAATTVFCVSHSIAQVAVTDNLVAPGKIKVFLKGSGNGVDTAGRFNPDHVSANEVETALQDLEIPRGALVCLFVGRITGDKGVGELVEAWKTVESEIPHARLVIVGTQDERDPLDALTYDDLQKSTTIVLAGKRQDTPTLFAAADIVVLPTYREGFPNVLLEASAMKKSIVATRIPGCTDAVEDGITGELVPVKDSAALADAILKLGNSATLRDQYGSAGRLRVEEYFDRRFIHQAIADEYARLNEKSGAAS